MKSNLLPLLRKNRVALVLQGGGALGAYQAGVYQALQENDLAPDWVVGTSIGAINAAIIAGNLPHDRVARLKQFWSGIAHHDCLDLNQVADSARRYNSWLATMDATLRGVPGFFAPRTGSVAGLMFGAGLAVEPEQASFYDTAGLRSTLLELIDFDLLNQRGGVRLSVNAVKVTSGELTSFDSVSHAIGVDHIMASGALPPGFPAVRIDGELYWDGGLYSNTPLETVLDDQPAVDTLCFMVDLWRAQGNEPTTLDEVQTRQKDVMFASRSKRHIDDFVRVRKQQRMLRALYQRLPEKLKTSADAALLQEMGCNTTLHIVSLPYAGQDWHMSSKDINFSSGSLMWRWDQGYADAQRAIVQAAWLAEVDEDVGVVVHDLAAQEQSGKK
ncbi:MAG: patatin-like phospholipase family protein [Janthinobacterium lividum]